MCKYAIWKIVAGNAPYELANGFSTIKNARRHLSIILCEYKRDLHVFGYSIRMHAKWDGKNSIRVRAACIDGTLRDGEITYTIRGD